MKNTLMKTGIIVTLVILFTGTLLADQDQLKEALFQHYVLKNFDKALNAYEESIKTQLNLDKKSLSESVTNYITLLREMKQENQIEKNLLSLGLEKEFINSIIVNKKEIVKPNYFMLRVELYALENQTETPILFTALCLREDQEKSYQFENSDFKTNLKILGNITDKKHWLFHSQLNIERKIPSDKKQTYAFSSHFSIEKKGEFYLKGKNNENLFRIRYVVDTISEEPGVHVKLKIKNIETQNPYVLYETSVDSLIGFIYRESDIHLTELLSLEELGFRMEKEKEHFVMQGSFYPVLNQTGESGELIRTTEETIRFSLALLQQGEVLVKNKKGKYIYSVEFQITPLWNQEWKPFQPSVTYVSYDAKIVEHKDSANDIQKKAEKVSKILRKQTSENNNTTNETNSSDDKISIEVKDISAEQFLEMLKKTFPKKILYPASMKNHKVNLSVKDMNAEDVLRSIAKITKTSFLSTSDAIIFGDNNSQSEKKERVFYVRNLTEKEIQDKLLSKVNKENFSWLETKPILPGIFQIRALATSEGEEEFLRYLAQFEKKKYKIHLTLLDKNGKKISSPLLMVLNNEYGNIEIDSEEMRLKFKCKAVTHTPEHVLVYLEYKLNKFSPKKTTISNSLTFSIRLNQNDEWVIGSDEESDFYKLSCMVEEVE